MTFIYELLCPSSGDVRYIGKSKDPGKRFKRHLQDSSLMKSYTNRWIFGLLESGLKPILRVVFKIGGHENWQHVERQCIALGFELGLPLTNTSAGGEGALITDPAVEARRVESVRLSWTNPDRVRLQSQRLKEFHSCPEVRKANSERMKATWQDDAYRKLCTDKVKQAYSSPEARLAQSARSTEAHKNPEVKARRSASLKAAWNVPGAREEHVAALKRANAKPEVKAWRAATMKERHQDPAFREKVRKTMADPEMIKRRGEAIKAGWAKRLERLAQAA